MERTWTVRAAAAACSSALLLALTIAALDEPARMPLVGDPQERITDVPMIPASYTADQSETEIDIDEISGEAADSIVNVGLRNAGRLLPLTKSLTIEALRRTAVSVGLRELDLASAEKRISEIDSVVLDETLYDWAEVDLEQPTTIRIGTIFAFYMTGSEEAVFLLGHQLAHVAAWDDELTPLIDSIRIWTGRLSSEMPSVERKEELMCDFIGEQVLKLYMFRYPTPEPVDLKIVRRGGGGGENDEG